MGFPSPSPARRALLLAVAVMALWLVAPPIPLRAQARPPAPQLAEALQRKYDTVRDFSASFVQTYEGGLLKRKTTERGRVQIKKPAKMRWEYETPEKKTFVSDGRDLYAHVPADRQVTVSPLPDADHATTAVLFLAGRGDLLRDFTAADAGDEFETPDTWALKLTPRKSQHDYDWLILAVDRSSLSLRRLVTVDAQGGRSAFTFTDLKENVGLSDKPFNFEIPRGVDVIRQE